MYRLLGKFSFADFRIIFVENLTTGFFVREYAGDFSKTEIYLQNAYFYPGTFYLTATQRFQTSFTEKTDREVIFFLYVY